jgi:hypothetical protein
MGTTPVGQIAPSLSDLSSGKNAGLSLHRRSRAAPNRCDHILVIAWEANPCDFSFLDCPDAAVLDGYATAEPRL